MPTGATNLNLIGFDIRFSLHQIGFLFQPPGRISTSSDKSIYSTIMGDGYVFTIKARILCAAIVKANDLRS